MEPTQSATPTNEAAGSSAADQPQNAQQNAGTQQKAGTDSSKNSSNQQAGGAKNWMEQAGLQKIVDQLPQGVREFLPNSWEQINKMTTTQKVAGAVALAGLGYLAMRSGKSSGKPSGKSGSKYAGSSESQRPNQNYRSGSRVHPSDYSSSSYVDESRRMDKGPNRGTGASFDRQNENRVGSYNSDGSTYSSSGTSFSDSDDNSSRAGRSTGYRGSSASSGSDFGSGV